MTAKQIITKTAVNIGRLLVAVTFIFSGFVKGMDPLGTQYKITDYLEALHIDWMFPDWSTLVMSVLLATAEFAIGIFLLFAIRRRLTSKITLAVMIVMTLITLWIVIADPVKDCGCFGDAVVLTNMETFIKNIILDNVLPGDIYIKSKELHFGPDVPRVVFLVKHTEKTDSAAIDVVSSLFPDKQKDFVINISETDLVLVKEVRPNIDMRDLVKIAKQIEDTLGTELMIKATIGIGTVAPQLKNIVTSFKEAQLAIEVGQVFDTEKTILSFENLGIGRLIYQLPTTMCEQFLSEVFRKGSISALDHETLFTIQKFFENNLNVSETSRKLFVHRNTLVYRLEKIKKITGLDLREFDHAIIFKVALMVRKYLDSRENRQ